MNFYNYRPEIWASISPEYSLAEVYTRFCVATQEWLAPVPKRHLGGDLDNALGIRQMSGTFEKMDWTALVEDTHSLKCHFAINNDNTWVNEFADFDWPESAGCLGRRHLRNRGQLNVVEKDIQWGGPHKALLNLKSTRYPIYKAIQDYELHYESTFLKNETALISICLDFLESVANNKNFLLNSNIRGQNLFISYLVLHEALFAEK